MLGCLKDIALTVLTLGLWIPIRVFFVIRNKSSAPNKTGDEVRGGFVKNKPHREPKFLQLNVRKQKLILESIGNDIIWHSFTPEIREKYGETNRLYASEGVRQAIDTNLASGIHPSRCRDTVGAFLEVETDRRKKENRRNGDMVEEVVMNYWFYKLGVSNLIECRDDDMLWGVKWLLHSDMKTESNSPCKDCKSLDGRLWSKIDSSVLLPVLDTHLGCTCMLDTVSIFEAEKLGLSNPKKRKKHRFL